GKYDEALKDADASLAIVGPEQNVPALDARSWALNGLRRHDEALKDSLTARRIKPSDGFALISEARALGGLGRRAEMLQVLREAAQAEPEKFGKTYQDAVQFPDSATTETLFNAPSAKGSVAAAASGGGFKMWHFLIYGLLGGALIAAGVLHLGQAREATT